LQWLGDECVKSFIFAITFGHGGRIRFQSQPLQIAKRCGQARDNKLTMNIRLGLLSILIIVVSQSSGQAPVITVSETNFDNLKGDYYLYWEIKNLDRAGEIIRLVKRNKFEYKVFSTIPGQQWMVPEQVIIQGNYKILKDTLKLKTTKIPKSYGTDILNFTTSYLIKSYKVTSDSAIGQSKNRTLVCLIPFEKLNNLDSIINKLPEAIITYQTNADDTKFAIFLNQLGQETENILFFKNDIFVKKN
jgi:hypothetical protein